MPSTLSKKVFLAEAITEFGMDNTPILQAFNRMLRYSKDDGLNIYFDNPVLGTDTNYEPDCHQVQPGGTTKLLTSGPCDEAVGNKKTVIDAVARRFNDNYQIYLHIFRFKDIDYYSVDESEMFIMPIALNPDYFYFDRDELLSFIYKADSKKVAIKRYQQDLASGVCDKLPAYLDQESDFYAEELDLAIQLHKAIQIDGYGAEFNTREERVNAWFNENKPNLGVIKTIKLKRLSSIIAIKKKIKK